MRLNLIVVVINLVSLSCGETYVQASGDANETYVFDVRSYKMVGKYARNNQKTASCEFSASGRELFVGHDDGANPHEGRKTTMRLPRFMRESNSGVPIYHQSRCILDGESSALLAWDRRIAERVIRLAVRVPNADAY